MDTEALNYDLPPDRIATVPVEPRDAAKLMVCDRRRGEVSHHRVRDLSALGDTPVGLPRAGDLMLVNTSRVVPARFFGMRSATGGRVEGLFLREDVTQPRGDHANEHGGVLWRLMLDTRGKPEPGERIELSPETHAQHIAKASLPEGVCSTRSASLELLDREANGVWRATLDPGDLGNDTWSVLDAIGSTPLPPYIRKARRSSGMSEEVDADRDRYNTVYAASPGSVAAPTAGLQFTPELLDALDARGVKRMAVTLHVGPGTFAPVRSARLEDHPMHDEWVEVPDAVVRAIAETREAGGRVLAVGTTTVRAIESVPVSNAKRGEGYLGPTNLFITPESNHVFRHTDALMTNFHLPKSTLLGMVSALPGVGVERLRQWYREAMRSGYRFYSYGDAMLVA